MIAVQRTTLLECMVITPQDNPTVDRQLAKSNIDSSMEYPNEENIKDPIKNNKR